MQQDVDFVKWTVPPVFVLEASKVDKEGTNFDSHVMPNVISDSTIVARHQCY